MTNELDVFVRSAVGWSDFLDSSALHYWSPATKEGTVHSAVLLRRQPVVFVPGFFWPLESTHQCTRQGSRLRADVYPLCSHGCSFRRHDYRGGADVLGVLPWASGWLVVLPNSLKGALRWAQASSRASQEGIPGSRSGSGRLVEEASWPLWWLGATRKQLIPPSFPKERKSPAL